MSASEGLAEDFARQRSEDFRRRVPAYDRILEQIGLLVAGDFAARFEDAWRGRRFGAWYHRPLLLLAALRFDALAEGPSHPLWRAVAAPRSDPDAVTEDALRAALRPSFFATIAARTIQTNETSRAVAWLFPARLIGEGRALALVDVGCAAGLNLVGDALPAIWTVETAARVVTVARLGLDRAPLDVRADDDVAWMRACIWAGETARLERFEAAVAALRAALVRGQVAIERAEIGDVPARLARLPEDAFALAYQTVVREYLAPEDEAAYDRGMRAWLDARPPGSAAWIELEKAPPGAPGPAGLPAALTAHVRGQKSIILARCGWHPTQIEGDERATEEFVASVTRR